MCLPVCLFEKEKCRRHDAADDVGQEQPQNHMPRGSKEETDADRNQDVPAADPLAGTQAPLQCEQRRPEGGRDNGKILLKEREQRSEDDEGDREDVRDFLRRCVNHCNDEE